MGVKGATLMNERLCDAQVFSLIGNLESRALRVETLCVPFSSNHFLVDRGYEYYKDGCKESGGRFS